MSEIFERGRRWLERSWDDRAAMVRYPSTAGAAHNPYQQPGVHLVRETAIWAAALLARGAPGDAERAERAISRVLAFQIDDPRSVAHGTWRRAEFEPIPGPEPREWLDYDPNWREFIGTALTLALAHDEGLTPSCVADIERALRLACEGTLERGVSAEYTNIAMMSAFLLDWAGDRLGESGWRQAGEALSVEVAEAYDASGAFPEHNSPTYYGIDLYGLALWRDRARSERMRARGAALEAALWRDLARFYHAGLRNLCGPYSRAYGMDMTRYAATLGCWIAAHVEPGHAPLPRLDDEVAHAHDLFELPLIEVLGSRAPDDVVAGLRAFQGDRSIAQTVTEAPRRHVTAQLRANAMWGGEHTSGRYVHWQHHPATVHWAMPDGRVGWLRVTSNAPVDAVATDRGLEIAVHTGLDALRDAELQVGLEVGPEASTVPDANGSWVLPGVEWRVRSDEAPAAAVSDGASATCGWRFAPGTAPERHSFEIEIVAAGDR